VRLSGMMMASYLEQHLGPLAQASPEMAGSTA
jgi:hypothetical protein